MIVHDGWTKSGRIFKNTEDPNNFIYGGCIGQKHVNLGNEEYAPYVWDKTNKILKFADHEIRFTANGLSSGKIRNCLLLCSILKQNQQYGIDQQLQYQA